MIIRGALNKKLAKGLKYTTQQNKWLTNHYYNYPETPEGFYEWSKQLRKVLDESNAKLISFQN